MFKVFKESCRNCLLTKDRIVSPKRAKDLIENCKGKQTYFICHKSDNVCCHNYYKELGEYSQLARIAERLNMVEFVEQTDKSRLLSHIEIEKLKAKK
jgi:hypothetical protein